MSSICNRCALRLQKASQLEAQHLAKRSFSSTSNRWRGPLPTFQETPNAELNNVLATMREKYFIPAYMHKGEQKLIFKEKYRQQLQDNPQTAIVGGEEIELQPIDRRNDIPSRRKLVAQALDLILNGESKDWQNLPMLLQGLNEGVKKPATEAQMEKIVRKAVQAKQLGVVLQCLNQARSTGMTLKHDAVLRSFMAGLHDYAQESGWRKGAVAKALRDANVIAGLLESDLHGTGRRLAPNDPRTRPEVLGVFLELAAAYAYKHNELKDSDGLVKAYAGRLLSSLEGRQTKPGDLQLAPRSKQWQMLQAISIWHGLSLAEKILGKDMPQHQTASKALAEYEITLRALAAELEARNPEDGTYDGQALTAWKRCITD